MYSDLMPREKLLKHGADTLTDAELLAIFLRTGTKDLPVMQLSESVLEYFGSLRAMLTATKEEFCHLKGLGEAKFVQLKATSEMTKRYLSQKMEANTVIDSPMLAIMYFQALLENDEREVFVVLFLDSQYRLILAERMFSGTINQTAVYPREVIKACLKYNAAAIIIAHNHPSGDCKPSSADRSFTEKIINLCELMEIRMLDHIIIGKGDYFSFEEEKLAESLKQEEN